MPEYYSTRQVAAMLGMRPDTLAKAIWQGRVTPPQKSPSGNFLWTDADINKASWVLCRRAYEPRPQGANEGMQR